MDLASIAVPALAALLMAAPLTSAAGGRRLRVANDALAVTYDEARDTFEVGLKGTADPFLRDGRFENRGSGAKVVSVTDPVLGKGRGIHIPTADGGSNSIEVYRGFPFALFRADVPNPAAEDVVLRQVSLLTGCVADDIAVNTLGTAGLLPPARNPGSYAFLAYANPATRRGLICAWLTHDRGSGVVFSPVEDGSPRVLARIDYGCLRVRARGHGTTETFLIGPFEDARAGLEAYADAVGRHYGVKLHPQQPGLCTWYMDKHAGACDESHLMELAGSAARSLGPYGFGFVQIDDGWQAGESRNGPNKNFTTHRPNGPYRSGMKATARMIASVGLTPGIWLMPFAGNWDDPWFRDHQDWFVRRRSDGKPYDTSWGGTCLDMTVPGARDYVRQVVSRIANDWGYRLFKLDGFWTGSATKQIYVNEGYQDDGIGDAVFHDPDVTNIQAMRSGAKLVREAAGPDVFLLGCCVSQNNRSFGGSFGLLDAMRVGPDTGSGTIGYPWATRLWFLNGRVWWNDPDCVSVRNAMSLDQARLNATFAAISGGLFYDSDWLPNLAADRVDVLRRCMPSHGLPARPVDVLEREPASVWHVADTRAGARRDIVALFNYGDQPATVGATAEVIGLPRARRYAAFDFWGNRLVGPFEGRVSLELPAHSCCVLAVKPVLAVPQLLSTSRHVTQGIVDVSDQHWNPTSQVLSATSRVVAGDPYELRILAPAGGRPWIVEGVSVAAEDRDAGVQASFRQEGDLVRVSLSSPVGGSVRWAVRFRRRGSPPTAAAAAGATPDQRAYHRTAQRHRRSTQ